MSRRKDDGGRKVARALGWFGVGLGAAYAVRRLTSAEHHELRQVRQAVTILRPREEVYAFFRRFENLPRFMEHIDAVETSGEKRSHWRVEAPAGVLVEWDAEIIDDRPNEHISWRSLPGADVENAGSVHFADAPGDRGTEVYLDLHYAPPAGRLGVAAATMFGKEPGQQARGDLRRLKQVLETGQLVHSDATLERGMHPARPSRDAHPMFDVPLTTAEPFRPHQEEMR